jgi:hypothetical protein
MSRTLDIATLNTCFNPQKVDISSKDREKLDSSEIRSESSLTNTLSSSLVIADTELQRTSVNDKTQTDTTSKRENNLEDDGV